MARHKLPAPQIKIRISPDLGDRIDALCGGLSRTEFARDCVLRQVECRELLSEWPGASYEWRLGDETQDTQLSISGWREGNSVAQFTLPAPVGRALFTLLSPVRVEKRTPPVGLVPLRVWFGQREYELVEMAVQVTGMSSRAAFFRTALEQAKVGRLRLPGYEVGLRTKSFSVHVPAAHLPAAHRNERPSHNAYVRDVAVRRAYWTVATAMSGKVATACLRGEPFDVSTLDVAGSAE